jgi:hypothetical protein
MTDDMTGDPWLLLERELDLWRDSGRQVRFWLRDDDAVAPSPALDRLAQVAQRFGAPALLAVIPMLAEPALASRLRLTSWLLPCQHGCWHHNHAPEGQKKSEFGANRSATDIRGEIAEARHRLGELFGPQLLPVFVPPWNRIAPGHAALLPELGLVGLSCFRNYAIPDGRGPVLANTQIDIMDWHGGRIGRTSDSLVPEICGLLTEMRTASQPVDATLGLLLHHRDHDDAAWSFLDAFLDRAVSHRAVTPVDPRKLFSLPIAG